MFVDKVRDIVGAVPDPPLMAMVPCVDEKSQIQALDRTQPMLPLGSRAAGGPRPMQRRFTRAALKLTWSCDIADLATDEVWLYLAAVVDLHSCQVVDEAGRRTGRLRWPRTRC